FRQPEKRNVSPTGLRHPSPSTHGRSRIHRSVLQPPTTTFQPRLPHPDPSLDRPRRPRRDGTNQSGVTRRKTQTTCPKNLTQPSSTDKPRRRVISVAEKLQHLEAYDAAVQTQQGGAYLRANGLYSSQIVQWRKQRDAGMFDGKHLVRPLANPARNKLRL